MQFSPDIYLGSPIRLDKSKFRRDLPMSILYCLLWMCSKSLSLYMCQNCIYSWLQAASCWSQSLSTKITESAPIFPNCYRHYFIMWYCDASLSEVIHAILSCIVTKDGKSFGDLNTFKSASCLSRFQVRLLLKLSFILFFNHTTQSSYPALVKVRYYFFYWQNTKTLWLYSSKFYPCISSYNAILV